MEEQACQLTITCTFTVFQGLFSNTDAQACDPGRGGYSHILAIRVCTSGKGMVFKPFSLV